jgi:hypothetical protein
MRFAFAERERVFPLLLCVRQSRVEERSREKERATAGPTRVCAAAGRTHEGKREEGCFLPIAV